jgi:hypothetical protein
MIYAVVGRSTESARFMQQAATINPRFESFHVHR